MTDNGKTREAETKELGSTERSEPELRRTSKEDGPASPLVLDDLSDIKTVGRYEIIRKLGQGSTGTVYLGRDPFIKRYVAIKMSYPAYDRTRDRFFVEAQAAGRLNHPYIVAVYDVGVYERFCYMTMEYIEGSTLKKFCHKHSLLPLKRAVEIIVGVCIALDYAHKQGVVHKDIKPSNIMLDKTGAIKVADFGISQMTEQTVELGILGTPSYMSPEQLKDQVVGCESDVFSLGCVLYEVLTGEKAFSGDNDFSIMYKITNEEPVSVLSIRLDLPEIFGDITNKALAKDPKERYQSCMALAYDLRVAYRSLKGVVENEKAMELVDFLRHQSFFRDFSQDQIKELLGVSNIITVRRGDVIVAEGEIDDTFYILLNGKAKVRINSEDIALLDVGECFGEMAGIGGQPRVATVVADTHCMLMKISATLLDRSPESIQLLFYKKFALTLVERLSQSIKTDN